MAMILSEADTLFFTPELSRTHLYPRLRYMGSKYKIIPYLVSIFSSIPFETALDAFSGSGVVGFAMKELGKQVVSNDYLQFSSSVARAVVENPGIKLDADDVDFLLSPNSDGRNFITSTFDGLYFRKDDLEFLDAIWSHIDYLPAYKRAIAIAAICLAASRKQPRGVFTITDLRYDDGRRNLHLPLTELFRIAVSDYNRIVFDNGRQNYSMCKDIFTVDPDGYDLVYLDPPYAPPHDDNDYIKRYHFLEGLSVYWQGQKIMENTQTKKIEKRFTPFAYKKTIYQAMRELIWRFRKSSIVLSYSSNSIPGEQELYEMLREVKSTVEVFALPHAYSFGTHANALRRKAFEFIFVAR